MYPSLQNSSASAAGIIRTDPAARRGDGGNRWQRKDWPPADPAQRLGAESGQPGRGRDLHRAGSLHAPHGGGARANQRGAFPATVRHHGGRVVYQNERGEIVSVNPAAERIRPAGRPNPGWTSADPLCGKMLREDGTVFTSRPASVHDRLRTDQAGDNGYRDGRTQYRARQTRWLRVNAIPLFEPGASEASHAGSDLPPSTILPRSAGGETRTEAHSGQVARIGNASRERRWTPSRFTSPFSAKTGLSNSEQSLARSCPRVREPLARRPTGGSNYLQFASARQDAATEKASDFAVGITVLAGTRPRFIQHDSTCREWLEQCTLVRRATSLPGDGPMHASS